MIIVHHDAPERCAATVGALRAQDVAVRVVVVDSGSSEVARRRLAEACPDVEIIPVTDNVGYGPGANVGLRRWLTDHDDPWVAVAAHDALPAPGCLSRLLAEGERRPDAAFVTAEFGDGFDMVPAVDWVIGGYYAPATRGHGWVDVAYPHGTLFLARRAALVEVGLFDERYFAYCEEVELGMRARALGWRSGLVWGAVVDNGHLPSQLLADYLQVRNTLLLVRTRFGRQRAASRTVLSVAGALGRARRDPSRWSVHLRLEGRAVVDSWRGRYGPPPPPVLGLVHGAEPAGSTPAAVGA